MTGSEKQIAWAEKIEKDTIQCCERNIEICENRNDHDSAECFKILKDFFEKGFERMSDASVIIDRRDFFNPLDMYNNFSMMAHRNEMSIAEVARQELSRKRK